MSSADDIVVAAGRCHFPSVAGDAVADAEFASTTGIVDRINV
jgi:hypothetical protein